MQSILEYVRKEIRAETARTGKAPETFSVHYSYWSFLLHELRCLSPHTTRGLDLSRSDSLITEVKLFGTLVKRYPE